MNRNWRELVSLVLLDLLMLTTHTSLRPLVKHGPPAWWLLLASVACTWWGRTIQSLVLLESFQKILKNFRKWMVATWSTLITKRRDHIISRSLITSWLPEYSMLMWLTLIVRFLSTMTILVKMISIQTILIFITSGIRPPVRSSNLRASYFHQMLSETIKWLIGFFH